MAGITLNLRRSVYPLPAAAERLEGRRLLSAGPRPFEGPLSESEAGQPSDASYAAVTQPEKFPLWDSMYYNNKPDFQAVGFSNKVHLAGWELFSTQFSPDLKTDTPR